MPDSWFTSATWPIPNYAVTSSTSPIAPLEPIHRPKSDQTCAMADRAADEQIAMYEEDLKAPCPKCGHVKVYDEDGNLS